MRNINLLLKETRTMRCGCGSIFFSSLSSSLSLVGDEISEGLGRVHNEKKEFGKKNLDPTNDTDSPMIISSHGAYEEEREKSPRSSSDFSVTFGTRWSTTKSIASITALFAHYLV